ncbi:MAG TPA: biotin carboxylase N-terminal domain-containing protein [Bryobacteraceae bacterium]|nr:biotin carboxylase N-terminal domain-containing protein [Bryobacteraceae bacterium]
MPTIRKLLIANRGEIVLRVARTARAMGISPTVIFSDADRDAPHTRAGDEAVAIGPSYLAIEAIIGAAQRVRADAIHPGYGFLAENADFAEACRSAGLIFVGPPPEAIRMMGLKTSAREIAARAGVPVVPAYDSLAEIQFPVLIKASAGGGGRGMRIVRSAEELQEALEAARGEAERAFGDQTLLLERYIPDARHVEFQIFGDHHGNLIHLFERDCSLQRRYQKLIEESPSPALTEELRREMGEAALGIARAIRYTNAGTVEFLLASSGEFYFIEVNTRLQVEHPVTELVTGIDLVRLQIEVAEGKPLPGRPRSIGHAIEARLNAEQPLNDFLPATGTVRVWRRPENVRVDTALEPGTEVGIHYDSLLAKIVAFGRDRESARRQLVYALRNTVLFGVETNRDYLVQLLKSAEFREGRAHTAFLPEPEASSDVSESIAAAVLYLNRSPAKGIPPNYRNNPYRDASMKLRVAGEEVTASWKPVGDQEWAVCVEDRRGARTHACRVHTLQKAHNGRRPQHLAGPVGGGAVRGLENTTPQITLTISGIARTYEVYESADTIYVHTEDQAAMLQRMPRLPRRTRSNEQAANSPMPGKVLRILVRQGQKVNTGDPLVVLEAMKMEQTIRTTINGVVESILVNAGQVVAPGQMLVQIAAQENS